MISNKITGKGKYCTNWFANLMRKEIHFIACGSKKIIIKSNFGHCRKLTLPNSTLMKCNWNKDINIITVLVKDKIRIMASIMHFMSTSTVKMLTWWDKGWQSGVPPPWTCPAVVARVCLSRWRILRPWGSCRPREASVWPSQTPCTPHSCSRQTMDSSANVDHYHL